MAVATKGTSIIRSGSGVPAPSLGGQNDFYVDSATGDYYIKQSGSWNLEGNLQGPQGVAGANGTNGTNGANGAPGSQILTGSGVPSNSVGVDGDFFIRTDNSAYYSKVSGAWVFQGTFVSGSVPNGGTTNQALVKLSNADGDVGWGTVVPSGSFTTVAGFDETGDLFSIPGWGFNSVKGIQLNNTVEPDNLGGNSVNNFSIDFKPLQNSPNESWNYFNKQVYLDPDGDGFTMGTAGEFLSFFSLGITHLGKSDVGSLSFLKTNYNIGNGADPISVKGLAYAYGFGAVNANVTLTGPLQGWGFQPTVNASATINSYGNAFYDFAQINTAIDTYQSFAASPIIAEIRNNSNYVVLNSAPTITTLTGNAGCFGFTSAPNITTMNTGNYFGVNIAPTIGSGQGAFGLYANMQNANTTFVRALDLIGDANIVGDLSFTGSLSIGQLNAFYGVNASDGGGTPASNHGLISSVIGVAGTTTANVDRFGVNTAMLVTLNANSVNTSGPFRIGFTALGLPCVVQTHTGSTLDYMGGAVFAVSLDPGSTGGTIDTLNLCRSIAVPNGITTVNKVRGFYYDELFGAVGVSNHAFYNEYDAQTYLKGGVKIGGTTDVVTNDDIGLELEGKLFLLGKGTTAERDGKTAVNGVLWYNTDTDKFQGYAAAVWQDLH